MQPINAETQSRAPLVAPAGITSQPMTQTYGKTIFFCPNTIIYIFFFSYYGVILFFMKNVRVKMIDAPKDYLK